MPAVKIVVEKINLRLQKKKKKFFFLGDLYIFSDVFFLCNTIPVGASAICKREKEERCGAL